jgi:hypothetical protein
MRRKNVKPVVRKADLVMAVAAARTAWIMTDVSQDDNETYFVTIAEPHDPRWMFKPGSSLNIYQCVSAIEKRVLCVN